MSRFCGSGTRQWYLTPWPCLPAQAESSLWACPRGPISGGRKFSRTRSRWGEILRLHERLLVWNQTWDSAAQRVFPPSESWPGDCIKQSSFILIYSHGFSYTFRMITGHSLRPPLVTIKKKSVEDLSSQTWSWSLERRFFWKNLQECTCRAHYTLTWSF